MLVTLSGIVDLEHPRTNLLLLVLIIELHPPRESKKELSSSTVIVISPEQPENADSPMFVTSPGISIDANLEQPANAASPMFVTLSGSLIDVNFGQDENADVPIIVTPSGIVTDIRHEQPVKAEVPILVTPIGIVIDVNLEQLKKAHGPMLVTGHPPRVSGIEMAPVVDCGTATAELPEATPVPIVALPELTVKVHVTSSTVSVLAKQRNAMAASRKANSRVNVSIDLVSSSDRRQGLKGQSGMKFLSVSMPFG